MAVTYDAPSSSSNWDNEYVIETLPTIFPQAGQDVWSAIIVKKIVVQKKSEFTIPSLGASITYSVPNASSIYQDLTMYLYEVTEPEDIGGGLCKFTKSYGTTPDDYSSVSIEVVTFPGFYSEWDADNPVSPDVSVYRPPLTKLVEVKEDHSFVLNINPISGSSPVLSPNQVMTIQNAQKEYVDYVDDSTLARDGSDLTYDDYQTMITSEDYFVFKPPVLQRAYGAGYVWELIEYTTKAI
jgi:hypothetical protein